MNGDDEWWLWMMTMNDDFEWWLGMNTRNDDKKWGWWCIAMIFNNWDTILIGNNVDSSYDDNKIFAHKLCILKSILYQESVAIFCTNHKNFVH